MNDLHFITSSSDEEPYVEEITGVRSRNPPELEFYIKWSNVGEGVWQTLTPNVENQELICNFFRHKYIKYDTYQDKDVQVNSDQEVHKAPVSFSTANLLFPHDVNIRDTMIEAVKIKEIDPNQGRVTYFDGKDRENTMTIVEFAKNYPALYCDYLINLQ